VSAPAVPPQFPTELERVPGLRRRAPTILPMVRTGNPGPPAEVEDAARRRSDARVARDWDTADRLRGQIEAAGWRVVDAGTSFRLEPASPADVEVGGEIRYGRSDAVPSRLDEPASGTATVVIVASPETTETIAALESIRAVAPSGVDAVVVADGLSNAAIAGLHEVIAPATARPGDSDVPAELIRTSEALGYAAALNIGIRRSRTAIVIALDPSIVPTGDVVTPLARALDDPSVAIAGAFGLRSDNLRQFEETLAGPAVAVQGYLMAFRRADAAERGPLDEGFRFYRNLDIWWSLVLRDAGEGATPRRAIVVPDLPLRRGEPHAWRTAPAPVRDRLSKRNFYRVLDRFRTRLDLSS
jgi:hypothetical protein